MTNGEYTVSELIKKRKKIEDLEEEILDFEADLCGMEIDDYKGHDYAIINFVDGEEVNIYCENDSGEEWEESITLEELLEIVKR